MDTLTHDTPRTIESKRSRWWLIAVLVVVVIAAIAGGVWMIWGNQSDDDQAVATELYDTWARGWDENDADAVRSVFADDAVYSDVPWDGGGTWTVEQHVGQVAPRGGLITNTGRAGELAATDHGTYIVVAEFDAHGQRYSGEIEIELEGDLIARMEWLSLDVIDS
jgi:ketosteroid isomerase-like protein